MLKNNVSFNFEFSFIILNSFIKLFFQYGLGKNIFYSYSNFFYNNILKKFFKKKKFKSINIVKVKVKINKKSFNTYFKRSFNKFLNTFSLILFNFQNVLVSFIFLFKPKKVNINLFLQKFYYSLEKFFRSNFISKYTLNVYNF